MRFIFCFLSVFLCYSESPVDIMNSACDTSKSLKFERMFFFFPQTECQQQGKQFKLSLLILISDLMTLKNKKHLHLLVIVRSALLQKNMRTVNNNFTKQRKIIMIQKKKNNKSLLRTSFRLVPFACRSETAAQYDFHYFYSTVKCGWPTRPIISPF